MKGNQQPADVKSLTPFDRLGTGTVFKSGHGLAKASPIGTAQASSSEKDKSCECQH